MQSPVLDELTPDEASNVSATQHAALSEADKHRVGAAAQVRTDELFAVWDTLPEAPDPYLPCKPRARGAQRAPRLNLGHRVRRGRGGGRPGARRPSSGGGSSGDPDEPEPALGRHQQHVELVPRPGAIYTFGCLSLRHRAEVGS
jgi:hypothetical protein